MMKSFRMSLSSRKPVRVRESKLACYTGFHSKIRVQVRPGTAEGRDAFDRRHIPTANPGDWRDARRRGRSDTAKSAGAAQRRVAAEPLHLNLALAGLSPD
jgi:hypothetical protein